MKLQKLYDWGDDFKAKPRLFLESVILPAEVNTIIELANDNGIKLVLVGANAANAYTGKPRNSQDVDFICDKPEELVKLVRDALPHITIDEREVVYRLYKDGEQFVDIIRPYDKLVRTALSRSSKYQGFIIPTVEVMIALKYAAMISPNRDKLDQQQDAVDLARMVRNTPELKLVIITDAVSEIYDKAAENILEIISDVRAGRPIKV